MDFKEILKEKNNNFDIILGYNKKEKLIINLKEKPSIIITGATGTSKSILMHEILLELINKNNYNELKIIPIAKTKVELEPYANSKYSYCNLINDKEKVINKIIEINELIEARKKLFSNNKVKNFDEYNQKNKEQLPFILLAIDEATDILNDNNAIEPLLYLINNCLNNGVALILNTNNVYNEFFGKENNNLASIKISFDFTTNDEAILTNLNKVQDLPLRQFLIKINNEAEAKKYTIMKFNDEYINQIINDKQN